MIEPRTEVTVYYSYIEGEGKSLEVVKSYVRVYVHPSTTNEQIIADVTDYYKSKNYKNFKAWIENRNDCQSQQLRIKIQIYVENNTQIRHTYLHTTSNGRR